MDQGQTGGVPGSADSAGAAQSGTVPIEAHGGGQSGMGDAGGEVPKKSQSQSKKASSFKYIKEEKLAILQVLLEIGSELWEMEKAINKPWRMLYWEQRVALPIREQLRNNYRYMDIGFDIDQRFGSPAGIENLRKWVRSQRAQETERVEAERNRLPGSPPGRPLSEVQKLRARVFVDIINAEKNGTAGDANAAADGHGGEGGAQAQSTPGPATQAAGGGSSGGISGGGKPRDASMEPLSTLFPSPSNGRNGGNSVGELSSSGVGFHGGNAGTTSMYGSGGGGFSEGGGVGAHPAVSAAAAAAISAAAAVAASEKSTAVALSGSPEGRPSAAAGLVRRRLPTESTPDDFRRGDLGAPASGVVPGLSSGNKKKKAKVDHSEVVGKVLAQVNNLNLPLAALELLVESLRAEIAEAKGVDGSPPPTGHVAGAAPGAGGSTSPASSLAERQLQLEERVHVSREVEAAQTLAERRLKLMEEMRAAGDPVVTEDVIQKQRLVVLGLEVPLVPRGASGVVGSGGGGV